MAIKVAFFSPLPPARSGIADYSAALLDELKKLVDVEVFASKPLSFNPRNFDVTLYQVGNNVYHDFCYETAMDHPGVVVVHEANLHHLIADITIKRGDWDAYMRAVEQEGSPADLAYAGRVRKLEVGPDYEGVPMLRQLLSRSQAAIVHSGCVESELRGAGFSGAVARIPHGAWIPDASRSDFRERLGLDETTPLVGIFGFLKPYKRIAESLRAFRRLVRVHPSAKMILVGDPHPELQLESLIRSLDLGLHVRVLGFRPIEEFVGYLAACDIVLNLRYPTVGENSGTLDACARPGQSGGGIGGGIVQRTSRDHLPESARGRQRRGSPFRVSQSAGEPPRSTQGAGRPGARVGGDRVYLASSGAALRRLSGANRAQRFGVRHGFH